MNNLLQLKGEIHQKPYSAQPGPPNLPTNGSVSVEHLEKLVKDIKSLHDFWKEEAFLSGALVSVVYKSVIAKSRRISATFAQGSRHANDSIVGAKFRNSNKLQHVITHYISKNILEDTLSKYKASIAILNEEFHGKITYEDIATINKKGTVLSPEIKNANFVKIIVNAFYVEAFTLETQSEELSGDAIITLYKTDLETRELLERIGISILSPRIFEKTTVLLTPDQFSLLKQKAPYLIAMGLSDLSKLTKTAFAPKAELCITIPNPTTEPTIGVIDTLFNENVYFSKWVEYTDMVDPKIPRNDDDYFHGTAVSSIIVDGATINPSLDDGCGRFRVRHFGVALSSSFSSFTIIRSINEIITQNRDIKVWNLSLGAIREIHPHFISPEGAILDHIQSENDVIFVVAGTNKETTKADKTFIGAPADSINSLVVNSVNHQLEPASYSRCGPVLSFFTKPDVAYYGGDTHKKISVCTHTGESIVSGTSFAAPWIARKLSYLIDKLGLSREVAKALIVHVARGWSALGGEIAYIGHGIVPQKIDDIISCPNDEIRFVLSGTSLEYDTYTYNLPVPIYNNKHPFIAKATLCYFPVCSRNQGVDYTNTEFDLAFGRIDAKGEIKSINEKKGYEGEYLYEEDARKLFRKWDNVKHILEVDTQKKKEKKAYSGLWGISIKTHERLQTKHGIGINFGLVVTLKNILGENKIHDFIKQCQLRGWLVNKIDVETRIEIYNSAEEEIHFDDL